MSRGVKVSSPAKVNLCLNVLGRRPDGFHDIFSVMQPIGLYDHIEISEGDFARPIVLECSSPELPTDAANIAYRAAELFFRETGLKKSVRIRIEKKIPIAAGLGGGSSNAAAVLMGLDELFNARLGEEKLLSLSALLGSDVPFFALRGPAEAEGRGERLKRIVLPEYYFVLVNPGFKVSTERTYGNYDNLNLTKNVKNNILSYSVGAFVRGMNIKDYLTNDLEPVVAGQYPEILTIKQGLLGAGADGAMMSGSGPTVFGIFIEKSRALHAFDAIKGAAQGKGHLVFLADGLTG